MLNNQISIKLLELYHVSGGRYGCIKLRFLLAQAGYSVSLAKVLRLMKSLNIRSIVTKKFRPSASSKDIETRDNLVKQNFNVTKPNQLWLCDITYIHTLKQGWTYLASVLDSCTRKIVGYSYSTAMTSEIVCDALSKAYLNQGKPSQLTVHSDRGSQYTSTDYLALVKQLGFNISFSAKGCPYDNAPIESWHSLLKKEEVYTTRYFDFFHAKQRLFEYIEGFYNRNRIHSAIHFLSPVQYEAFLFNL